MNPDEIDAARLQDARDDSDPGPDSDYAEFAAEEADRMWDEIEPDPHSDPQTRVDALVDKYGPPSSDLGAEILGLPPDWRDRYDTRDDSDPGPLSAPTSDEIATFQERLDRAAEHVRELPEDERQAWRDRYDTREEFEGNR